MSALDDQYEATINRIAGMYDEVQAECRELRDALTVVAAVLLAEQNRSGGQPFTGRWSIPSISFSGTVSEALDMANAALASPTTLADEAPPISPEEAQFNAVRYHERFGPLDEKGNPLDPRRRG